jgi:hypothetical protein
MRTQLAEPASPYISTVEVDTTPMTEEARTKTIRLLFHTIQCPIVYQSGTCIATANLTAQTVGYRGDIMAAFRREGGVVLNA